jgi:hypothetical protein
MVRRDRARAKPRHDDPRGMTLTWASVLYLDCSSPQQRRGPLRGQEASGRRRSYDRAVGSEGHERLNKAIRARCGKAVAEPPPQPEPEARPPFDYGAGARADSVPANPHAAMGRWLQRQYRQLGTGSQRVIVPTRRTAR